MSTVPPQLSASNSNMHPAALARSLITSMGIRHAAGSRREQARARRNHSG